LKRVPSGQERRYLRESESLTGMVHLCVVESTVETADGQARWEPTSWRYREVCFEELRLS